GASWHKEDVEAFHERALALPVVEHESGGRVSLQRIMRLKLRDDDAKADIVAALLDGRLPVVGREGRTRKGLQVERAKLEAFVVQKRIHVEGETYSYPDAASALGVDLSAIPNARSVGLLEGVSIGSRTRISSKSVEQ